MEQHSSKATLQFTCLLFFGLTLGELYLFVDSVLELAENLSRLPNYFEFDKFTLFLPGGIISLTAFTSLIAISVWDKSQAKKFRSLLSLLWQGALFFSGISRIVGGYVVDDLFEKNGYMECEELVAIHAPHTRRNTWVNSEGQCEQLVSEARNKMKAHDR